MYPAGQFSPPVAVPDLRLESETHNLLPAVISRGKALLATHNAWMASLQEE